MNSSGYEGRLYRPPSEAESFILQASIGCSWNKCTYCDMYRDKEYRERPISEILADIVEARRFYGDKVFKVFVADGDPLHMPMETWRPILEALRASFPNLRRVSTYAMATNVLAKSDAELRELSDLGLTLLYIGPESGSDAVLGRIAKGSDFEAHAEAARRAHAAGMKLSTIFLLGAGGTERSEEHARESARLATAMDPAFLSALTLTVVPGTPIAKLEERGRFTLPDTMGLLRELHTLIDLTRPTAAIFRSNHASNYLPLSGVLPRDRKTLLRYLDAALDGSLPLRQEWMRGL